MTETELNTTAKIIAKELWGLDLNIPVVICNKLRTCFGALLYYKKSRKPLKIKIAKFFINSYSKSTVIAILAHEIAHWALLTTNRMCRDKDKEFQQELLKFGIPMGNDVKLAGTYADFKCCGCNQTYNNIFVFTNVRDYINNLVCKSCEGTLKSTNIKHVKDKNNFKIRGVAL